MASQVAIFAETIAGMKKAIKRKAYDSDSDNSIESLTNRGNKLRKKARFVREGQLAPPSGPQVYRRTIEHAGYQRDIISRNPPIIDEDGYEVDSDDDDDDERAHAAVAAAAELDPYSDVKLENLLVPLTAASDLPDHPTLSKPFTSNTLTELTRAAGEMVQKEKTSLWKIKHLLTKLSGDSTWYPCKNVETDNDFALFMEERDKPPGNSGKVISTVDGDQASSGTYASDDSELPERLLAIEDVSRDDRTIQAMEKVGDGTGVVAQSHHTNGVATNGQEGLHDTTKSAAVLEAEENSQERKSQDPRTETGIGAFTVSKESIDGAAKNQAPSGGDVDMLDGEPGEDHEDVPQPRRMRTRAQAQAASDNSTIRSRSATPNSGNEMYIHPYFLAPASSRPDRNVGLPPPEADEARRLMQLYVQKQEEVCRGAQKVYEGLLKADRHRKSVLKWAKAEAHVGLNRDMSDGEDWYDKEEWGLDEDLKKGQDEEEEDAATTAKKTRARRQ